MQRKAAGTMSRGKHGLNRVEKRCVCSLSEIPVVFIRPLVRVCVGWGSSLSPDLFWGTTLVSTTAETHHTQVYPSHTAYHHNSWAVGTCQRYSFT